MRRQWQLKRNQRDVRLPAGLRGVAAPVALASVDLSRTIAGGELLRQGSLPKPPRPFGLPTQAAPVFGVPSRTARLPQQEVTADACAC